jgi:hypothetical protein
MNSNLVPTPIVDKNGVPSTRLKKVDGVTGKASNIPAPYSSLHAPRAQKTATLASFFSDRKERKQLATEIINRLWSPDDRLKHGFVDGGAGDFIAKIKDLDYLRDLNAAAELVTRKELGKDRYNDGRDSLISMIFKNEPTDRQKQKMRTIARYSDWMRENNVRFGHFMLTYDALAQSGATVTLEDGTIRSMEAHCQVVTAMEDARSSPYTGARYVRNSNFGDAVDKYPEHVEPLVSYISERGIKNFDEDDFLHYLDGGAVADGWL